MEPPQISVVMIVKNEADRIDACLTSLTNLGPLLHEICIYDTGSTDDTITRARAHGATVHEGYWDDDFARARNAAAAMATSNWLLVVDADEELSCDVGALARILTESRLEPDGFFVAVSMNRDASKAQISMSPRLYQPSRLHYARPVHEALSCYDDSAQSLWTVPAEILQLRNRGFDAARAKQSVTLKEHLTDKILATEEGATDGSALLDRGRARMGQGRHLEALDDLVAADRALSGEQSTYAMWAKELIIEILLVADRADEATDLVDSLEDLMPGRDYTRWQRGRVFSALGMPSEAFNEHSLIGGALDAGFAEVSADRVYRACLEEAVEGSDIAHIIPALVALTGLEQCLSDYGPLLVRWWGERPVEPLFEAFALCADRSVDHVAKDLITLGGSATILGERLLAASRRLATPGRPARQQPAPTSSRSAKDPLQLAQALFDARRHTPVSALVSLLAETLEETASSAPAATAAPAATVTADWTRPAPALAALSVYAHAYAGHQDAAYLALVVPRMPSDADHTALGVLIDSLDPSFGTPQVTLVSSEETWGMPCDVIFEPRHDESDLLALAHFSNAVHDLAETSAGMTAEGARL